MHANCLAIWADAMITRLAHKCPKCSMLIWSTLQWHAEQHCNGTMLTFRIELSQLSAASRNIGLRPRRHREPDCEQSQSTDTATVRGHSAVLQDNRIEWSVGWIMCTTVKGDRLCFSRTKRKLIRDTNRRQSRQIPVVHSQHAGNGHFPVRTFIYPGHFAAAMDG